MSEVKNSDDAYRRIHGALAGWVEGGLEDGMFMDNPVDMETGRHWMNEFLLMAAAMREIEGHTVVEPENPDD